MTGTLAAPAGWSRWRLASLAVAAGAAALVILFWETAASMERTWRASDSFHHTYLVPFILAWLVWDDRARLAAVAPQPEPRGLLLVLAASLFWLLGWAAQAQVAQQLGLIGMAQGLILSVFGWPVVRVLLFPLLFMVFLVPMGDVLVPTLQDWTARFLVWSVGLLGIPIATDGYLITLADGSQPYHRFHVAKECSGIRYLTAMFQIGLLAAYLLFRSWPRRVAAVAVALVVPVVANWLRALGIVLIAYYSEGERGMDIDHIIYGFWFFLFVLAVYIGICWLFAETPPRREPARFPAAPAAAGFARRVLGVAALAVLAAAAGPLYARTVDGAAPAAAVSLGDPPAHAGPWRRTAYLGLDWRPRYPGADAELLARYARGGDTVDLYVAGYARQRQGAELVGAGNDLAGDGWADVGERRLVTLRVDGEPRRVRYLRLARPERQRAVFYWYLIDGGVVSGNLEAKLRLTGARLLGPPGRARLVAVAVDIRDGGDPAALVGDFLAALPVAPLAEAR